MRRSRSAIWLSCLVLTIRLATAGTCENAAQNKYVCVGSNGFIGSALAQKFAAKGSLVGLGRNLQDLTQEQWCSRVTSVDDPVVFFAAGRPGVAEATRDPQGDYDALIVPLKKLLGFMHAGTLFFISSAAVYSPGNAPHSGFTEDGPVAKNPDAYARHRILAEDLVREHAATHPNFTFHILRPSNVFGENQRKQIIFDLGRRFKHDAQAQKETLLWGTGNETRDFIHVDYIADFCERLDNEKPPSGTWNICSGQPTTIAELVESIRKYFSLANPYRFDGQSTGSESPLSTDKSAQILSPEGYSFLARKYSVLKAYQAAYE